MSPRAILGLALAVAAGCALDFDRFDPRLAPPADGAGGSGASTGMGGAGGSPTGGGASTGGAAAGGAPAGGSGGGGPLVLEYVATVSDCIDPALPDPEACAASQPAQTMGVDADISMGEARHSYLRFDLDQRLAGRTILEVILQVTACSDPGADSPSSGEVWEVAPFSRLDLFDAAPATQGSDPVAGDPGAVDINQTVSFPIPASLVARGGSVYLGILPLSTNGVDYWNRDGAVPPKLVITAR